MDTGTDTATLPEKTMRIERQGYRLTLVAMLLVSCTVLAVINPSFFTATNLRQMAVMSAPVLMAATGQRLFAGSSAGVTP